MSVTVIAKPSIVAFILFDILADGLRTLQDSIEQLSQSQAGSEENGIRSRSGDLSEGYSTGNEDISGFPVRVPSRWFPPFIPRTFFTNSSPTQDSTSFPPIIGADSLQAVITQSIEKAQLSIPLSSKRGMSTFILNQSNDEAGAAKTRKMLDETGETFRAKRGKSEMKASNVEEREERVSQNDENAFKADHKIEAARKGGEAYDTKTSPEYAEALHKERTQTDNTILEEEGEEGVSAKKEDHKYKRTPQSGVDEELVALGNSRNDVAFPVLRRPSEELTQATFNLTLSEVVEWAARALDSALRDIIREWVDAGRITRSQDMQHARDGDYYLDSKPEPSDIDTALTDTTVVDIYSGDPEPHFDFQCVEEKFSLKRALNLALVAYESWMQVPDEEFLNSLPPFIDGIVNHMESSLNMTSPNAKGQLPHEEALFKEALKEMTRHLLKLEEQYYQELYSYNYSNSFTYT